MIKCSHLSKSYGNKLVLDDISCLFEKGKVYGIAGENGAGKTTFFRCLAGLEISEGSISTPFKVFKNHLGFLETNPIFMSLITGNEYLQLLCQARNIHGINFEDFNVFDLPLDQYAENYSTGMKKKLAILGLLLQKNDVFILDEPFNGVDIHSNIIIIEIIKKLKENHKTLFISSHIFSTLSACCDEILLLKSGKIHSKVTPEGFEELEDTMKDFVLGDRLEHFDFK